MVRRATRTATTTATATRISSTLMVNQPPGTRAACDEPEEQVVIQSMHALGERPLGVDRLVEFALRGVVRGVAVDVDGGHVSGSRPVSQR